MFGNSSKEGQTFSVFANNSDTDKTVWVFEKRKNASSIIFLDDTDKFANEDDRHCGVEAYVAVQAGSDNVNDTVLRVEYDSPDDFSKISDENVRKLLFMKQVML